MNNSNRQYKLPLAELIDKLTITQLRELHFPEKKDLYSNEIKELSHDVDLAMEEMQLQVNAHILRIVFLIGQLNTLIWTYKNNMELLPDHYANYLKLSHQVNGLKNQLKNMLSETGKTNISTDGLNFFVSL
jgi:hypothetical protein